MAGMIGGQQAMFGNFASYAQQITPGGPQGPTPTYSNPMAGVEQMMPSPVADTFSDQMGVRSLSAIGNIGLPAIGTAAMLGGSFIPGVGKALGALDPMSAGIGGFVRGAGLRSGGMGIMGNLGRIAQGGIGGIARAGIGGVAGGLMAAAPALAVGAALQYGVGQMVQGAQFEGQVGNFLQNQFRHVNPQSYTGFGFGREETGQIASMVREMGHKEFSSSPQEMLNLMKSGTSMGLMRGVQDVKEFRQRFTDMVTTLKNISKEMNTTLEGALPFFQQARQMGFWTPQDITKNAQMARQTAGASGMSVAQTQQMMGQGAQMARQIGALGAHGAEGMARTLQMVGGGLRSGAISEQQLSEATGGLQGSEAVQSMAGTLQAATTRFASGTTARWLLASMGRKGFTQLDPLSMQRYMSGGMSLGEIGGSARGNIGRQGAFNFVMNEQELRGQLVRQGPEAQLGLIRTLVGGSLYGDDPKSKYITRRLMGRYFGTSARQSDMLAEMAREAPRIMQENEARGAASLDQEMRNRDESMNRTWEGVKRQAAKWWDSNVKEPMQKFGADMSRSIAGWWERMSDKFWGSTPARHRLRGITEEGMGALQRAAMGDSRQMETVFGRPGQMEAQFGPINTGLGVVGQGITRSFQGQGGGWGGLGRGIVNMFGNVTGSGEFTNARIETLRRMGVGEVSFKDEATREWANRQMGLVSGRTSWATTDYRLKSMAVKDIERAVQGLSMAQTGQVTAKGAAALGFESEKQASEAIKSVQAEMGGSSFQIAAARLAHGTKLSGRALGEAMVREVEQGRMGGEALRKYVQGGKDMQAKVHRLAAAQSKEGRQRFGAIDLAPEAEALGMVGLGGIEQTEAALGKAMERKESELAAALSTQPEGARETMANVRLMGSMAYAMGATAVPRAGVSANTIAKLRDKPAFRQMTQLAARRAVAVQKGKADEVAAIDKQIADLNAKVVSDKTLPDAEREAMVRMMDPNDPGYKQSQGLLAQMGVIEQVKNRAGFKETIIRRRQRMVEEMGEQKEVILNAFDKVKPEGGGRSVGSIVRELVNKTDMEPEEYKDRIKELVAASGSADPKAMASVAELLKDQPGAEDLSLAVRGGMAVKEFTKRTAAGRLADPGRAASALHFATGIKLSAKEMKALTGSDEKAADEVKKRLTDALPRGVKENTEGILQAIRDKDPTKLLKFTQDRAAARAIGQLSDPAKNVLSDATDKMRKDKDSSFHMGIGSPKGMHIEMNKQTVLLASIKEAIEKKKPEKAE